MELFVINRHENITTQIADDENVNLNKVLQKIERNKRIRNKQKEKEQKIKTAKQRTIEKRKAKRELKSKIIPVPDNLNDEFLDPNFTTDQDVETNSKCDVSGQIPQIKKKKTSHVDGFTILGSENLIKTAKIKRILPKWLSNPVVISADLQNLHTRVSDIKQIDRSLRKLLIKNGINYLFPVQAEVIPWLIESNKHSSVVFPQDICVSAPTGSGKTLAFVLPVLQALKRHSIKRIRALVILPTQDLAKQVFKTFKLYSENTSIDIGLITGQNSFEIEQKQLVSENDAFGYISKMDILICTAGRLVDHLKLTRGFNLQNLEFLIIDEADRVLESVQNDWLYHLENHINQEEQNLPKVLNVLTLQKWRPPQKLLFSATLSQDPEKLQKLSLFQPKLFTCVVKSSEEAVDNKKSAETFIGKFTTPKELTERYIVTSIDLKPLVLYKFIKQEKLTKTLIFTHSLESTHRLAILLQSLFKDEMIVQEISSHLKARNRDGLIKSFSDGKIDLLICTDALARGIDLPGVKCVISYSAPKYLKTYIHRAGRTARAGEQGLAVTLLHSSQLARFNSLLKQSNKSDVLELKIPDEDLESLGEQYKDSLGKLKEVVEKEEKVDLKKSRSAKRSKINLKRKRL